MSINLVLEDYKLWQTPTRVTYAALVEGTNPCDVYFQWLDAEVERTKPKLHPRASNAERKRRMSTPAWREYLAYKVRVEEHKRSIEQHIKTHPSSRWYAI